MSEIEKSIEERVLDLKREELDIKRGTTLIGIALGGVVASLIAAAISESKSESRASHTGWFW